MTDTTHAKATLVVHLPPVSEGQISSDLRWLTEQLMNRGAETTGGLLGGEFDYGAEFINDVFEMHPYYWGDCHCGFDEKDSVWYRTNEHQPACYQQVIRSRGFIDCGDAPADWDLDQRREHNDPIIAAACAEMGLDPEYGSHVHCTCDYEARYAAWRADNNHDPSCRMVLPNFRHKPSGSTVTWYKYVGRGMTTDLNASWFDIVRECLESLQDPTDTSAAPGDNAGSEESNGAGDA